MLLILYHHSNAWIENNILHPPLLRKRILIWVFSVGSLSTSNLTNSINHHQNNDMYPSNWLNELSNPSVILLDAGLTASYTSTFPYSPAPHQRRIKASSALPPALIACEILAAPARTSALPGYRRRPSSPCPTRSCPRDTTAPANFRFPVVRRYFELRREKKTMSCVS